MSFNADVVVRIESRLADGERGRLQQALAAQPGVRAVRADRRAPQLYVVSYDAGTISALGILRCLHAQGLAASLIGM
jgi:hypothetical protein